MHLSLLVWVYRSVLVLSSSCPQEWSRRAAEAKEEYQELMEEYKASGKAAAFEKKTAAASPAKGAKKSAK